MSLKIVIAETQDVLRTGLHTILATDVRVSEIYEATDERELQRSVLRYTPDLIVVNQDLVVDISILHEQRFVILANELSLAKLKTAYECGAAGYLSTNVSAELLCSLLCCNPPAFLIEPALVPIMMESLSNQKHSHSLDETLLTPREKEIVRLLRTGMDRSSIAKQLCITEATLKTHFKNITKKHATAPLSTISRRQKMKVLLGRVRQLEDIVML